MAAQKLCHNASKALKQRSEFFVCLKSIQSAPHCLSIPEDYASVKNVKSSIALTEIKPFIEQSLTRIWPDLSPSEVLVKVDGDFISNLFTKDAPCKQENDDTFTKSSMSILEGHCVQILRPEVHVNIYGINIIVKVSKLLKVKALKQIIFSHKQLPRALKEKLDKNTQSTISLNHRPLQNHEFIHSLDFTEHALQLEYPHICNGIINEFVQIYSKLLQLL